MKLIQNNVASSGIIRIRIHTASIHYWTAENEEKKTFCTFVDSKTNTGEQF